ncbi:MAG: carboxypeptidase regulatory-like domain-containing protein [Planctomycetes bacterium]|nr:carboxypeptidase regulatory-like domain-containing protein [Planctomycetota bacterium]
MKRAPILFLAFVATIVGTLAWRLFVGTDGDPAIDRNRPVRTAAEGPADPGNAEAVTANAIAPSRTTAPTDLPDPDGDDPDLPLVDYSGPPGSIKGRILDPKGNPTADAEVELVRGPSAAINIPHLWTRLELRVLTDPTGNFRFPNVAPNDDYIIVASHPDHGEAESGTWVVQPSTEKDVGDLRLREGVFIQGFVRCDGRPIQNALVVLSNAMDRLHKFRPDLAKAKDIEPFEIQTATDAEGRYEFDCAPFSNFEITAKADGFGTMTRSSGASLFGGASREHKIDFDLSVAMEIAGQVVDGTGAGIVGAKISASIANSTFRCDLETVSGADGRFRLQPLTRGDYFVAARCDGFSESHQQQVAAGRDDLVLEMRVQGSCLGIAVDESTGEPVTEFSLNVHQVQKARGSIEVHKNLRFSDSGGRFEVMNLDPGSYMLEASAAGYAASMSAEFKVERGQSTAGVRVDLHRGGTVTGIVRDREGNPVRNALIELRDNGTRDNPVLQIFQQMGARGPTAIKARSKEDGSFTLELVVPDTYQVAVKHNQYAGTLRDDVEIRKNETTDVGVLTVSSGGRVSGHAYDLDGRPLANATISAMLDKSAGFKQARSDKSGFYELTHLNDGTYTVSIQNFQTDPPQNPLVGATWARNSRQIVQVVDGDDLTIDLRLAKPDPNPPAPRGGAGPDRRSDPSRSERRPVGRDDAEDEDDAGDAEDDAAPQDGDDDR